MEEPRSHRPRASTLPPEMLERLREGKAMAKQGYQTRARTPKDEKKPVSSTPRTCRSRGDSIELHHGVFGDDSNHHERRGRSSTFSCDDTKPVSEGSASASSSRQCPSPNVHLNAHSMGHYRQRAKTMPSDLKRKLMLKFGRPASPGTPRTPSPPSPVTSHREEPIAKESVRQVSLDKDRHQTVVDGKVDNCSTLINAYLYMASDEAGAVHRDQLPKGSNAFSQVMEDLDPCKPQHIETKVNKSHRETKCPKKQSRPVKKRPQRHSSVIPPRPSDLVPRESHVKSAGCSSAPNSPPTSRHIHWGKTVTFDNYDS